MFTHVNKRVHYMSEQIRMSALLIYDTNTNLDQKDRMYVNNTFIIMNLTLPGREKKYISIKDENSYL